MLDKIFLDPAKRKADFNFDEDVARVFDDMLERSVPFYFEVQNMIVELVDEFLIDGTTIYDLGCSTGNTMLFISKKLRHRNYKMVGVDYSRHMLSKTRHKLDEASVKNYELVRANLNEDISFENMSIAIMALTLQFVRPLHRAYLIRNIYDSLLNNGCLILLEKVLCRDSKLNRSFIEAYYRYKERNNYSKMEIAAKRESLENVLVPYRLEENLRMLHESGFEIAETFFRWFNFTGIIAIKNKEQI